MASFGFLASWLCWKEEPYRETKLLNSVNMSGSASGFLTTGCGFTSLASSINFKWFSVAFLTLNYLVMSCDSSFFCSLTNCLSNSTF